MTISLLETTQVSQTLALPPPIYKPRAIIGFGHRDTLHGSVHNNLGGAAWGAADETDAFLGAIGWNITGLGSLETGGAGSRGTGGAAEFYGTNGGAATNTGGRMLADYLCAEVDLVAGDPQSTLFALLALGGVTLNSKVGVGQFTGTGAYTVSGLSFQPQLILMGGIGRTFFGNPTSNPNDPINFSFGAADANGNQFACCEGSSYLQNTGANRRSRFTSSACFLQLRPGFAQASLTSFNSDGFTLNVTSFSGSEYFWWIVLGDVDGDFAVGTGTAGDASISPGFEPEAVMCASSGNDILNADQSGGQMGLGASNPDLVQYGGWGCGAGGNVSSRNYWSNVYAIQGPLHPGAVVPSNDYQANFSSWGTSPGLTWAVGGASGAKFGWVAMKTSRGPGLAGCPEVVVSMYWRAGE